MNIDREERVFVINNFELRQDENGNKKIIGHAAVFNKLSEDLGGFRERISPGTFKKTIKEGDIRALFNHNTMYILGRNTAGTLRLKEDEKGLFIEIDPPDSQTIRDLVITPMERGDITQMSFGFKTIKDAWIEEEGKTTIRELQEVKLYDVSPVVFPAYPQTDVAVREYRNRNNRNRQRDLKKLDILKKKLDILNIM